MWTDELHTAAQEDWLETETGRYIFSRQEKLMMEMVSPVAGERILDAACGTGNHLKLFERRRCSLTGMDASGDALALARKKLGDACELVRGGGADFPFSDNEFDIVTLINALRTRDDPHKTIAEALRVSRSRVFVGFMNKFSFAGTRSSLRRLFGLPASSSVRFFTIGEMRSIVARVMANSSVAWGSVVCMPGPFYTFLPQCDEMLPVRRNPLGAFAGMLITVRYTYRTAENPLLNSFEMKTKGHAAPEAVRGMLQGRDR
jgi:ubiquinone/menaquinone biosynthesis C-methylase UbiE